MQSCMKIPKTCLELVAVLDRRHAVDACGGLALKRQECRAQSINGDMMEERCELRLPISSCCVAHTRLYVRCTACSSVLPFAEPLPSVISSAAERNVRGHDTFTALPSATTTECGCPRSTLVNGSPK
jgi:hypothetical protein